MNLRFKLLFPLIAGYVLLATLLHFFWIPLLFSDAQKNYYTNEQLMISTIKQEVIRDLISDDIASLYAYLDAQMKSHSHDWKMLEIRNSDGKLLYPFKEPVTDSQFEKTENIIEIQHTLNYIGNNLGSIRLLADWSTEKELIQHRLRELEFYLLFTFFMIVLFSVIWQSFMISQPVKRLTCAFSKFAEGDFNTKLLPNGRDEMALLSHAFNNMVEMRQSYEEERELLTRHIEMAFSELTEQKYVLDQHAIVTITDVQGTITYANEKFTEISGYSEEELLNQNHRILKSEVHNRVFFRDMYRTISKGGIWHGEICNKAKDGSLYWVDTTIAAFMGKNEKPQSYIAIRTDITQSKNVEKELINAKNMAEDAVKAKSEFLASMSHEIRTPMNGVLGMLSLLQNTPLNNDQQHRLSVAQSSARSLLLLINDILDFSKVDAGKMQLELIDFNLLSMLGEVAEAMGQQVEDKNIELILDTADIEQSMVKGDPGRLRQILTNIIGNAIKFTTEGEIVIKVSLKLHNTQQWQLDCCITDSGIGIPENKLASLFDSFSQVDSSTTRQYGGTGLGLAIVKKLCELMDGSVSVKSESGKGSSFTLNICLQKSELSEQVLPRIDIGKLHLLIVDDNATNREVLREQLEHWGARVTEASTAKHALSICNQQTELKDQDFFDLAFLDMQMPHMDGVELGKKLKSDSRFSQMKLIMMTSMGIQGNAQYFSELGFSGYFPKPATTSDLFEALSVVAEGGDALKHAEPLVTSHYLKTLVHSNDDLTLDVKKCWPENMRILLVEDNKVNQLVATGILNEFGLHVEIAEHGKQAIEKLTQSASDQAYTLVIMDCQMPVMDGYEATRRIRKGMAGDLYKSLPVIAMTANAIKGDREKCLQSGMSDYLAKPIEPEILLAKLKKWSNPGFLVKTVTDNSPISKSDNSSDIVIWNKESTLKRLMENEKLLHQLLDVFLEENPERLANLNIAIDSYDFKQIRYNAHTIKGVAASLGGMQLQKQCELMEVAADLDDMDDIKKLLPGVIQHSEELKRCFEAFIKVSED